MLSRIVIQNFRGLIALDIVPAQATVLVGPNSCGKTTVLQAVQLACSALDFAFSRRRIDGDKGGDGWLTLLSDKPIRDDQPFLPTTRWQELFSDSDTERRIEIRLHFSAEHAIQQLYVDLHVGRADALRMTVAIQAAEGHPLWKAFKAAAPGRGRRRDELHASLLDQIAPHLPRAIFIPAFYGAVREEEYRTRAAVDALLRGGQQGHVVRNLLVRLENLQDLNDFLVWPGLPARVERCTPRQQIDATRYLEVLFRDRNRRLELSSAGTGLASMLALYAAIHYAQPDPAAGRAVLFLFDEPEAHLHPRLQGDVAARLVEMVVSAGAQLLCATHSVEMINRLGRDPRAAILRIDRDRSDAVRLHSEKERLDELSEWCDLSPFAQLNLLSTRRIVFFEGPSDYQILEGCARLYLGSAPRRLKLFTDFTPAPLSGTGNLEAKQVLKAALLPVFKHLPDGESIRVVRLLDRDAGRRPRTEQQSDPATRYEELDVIRSRHSIESLFLDPDCLTDWLDAALNEDAARPATLDRAALLTLVQAAIAAANQSVELNQAAADRLTPSLVKERTNLAIEQAMKEARRQVEEDPASHQRGHDRDRFVLGHIRKALLDHPATKHLAHRVRRDIAQIVAQSPLRPNLLLPPALIPAEIKRVLDFMAPAGVGVA